MMTARANQTSLSQAPEVEVLKDVTYSLAQHMLASMDLRRKDRLWPADPMVFQTNALNLAYGASGTALFLYDVLGELPATIRDWLCAQPIDTASYPPGLYSGIAGIAWGFAEMGMLERGMELFRLVPESSLAFKAANIFNGASGWGMAALAFYLATQREQFRGLACRAGDYLLETAQHDQNGTFWRDEQDNTVRLGFGFGGSGIALFLLYLWRATGETKYLYIACEAIEFEIAHAIPQDNALLWGPNVGSQLHSPYWLRGGGGVATTLIRFAQILKDARYRALARKAARPCATFFSIAPHLFEGLASMGETLLDMFVGTGDPFYLEAARLKASQTLLYSITRPQGTAFPGRLLLRISHDYGVGGAGIGLFLRRMASLKPRRLFHDVFTELCFPK